MKVLKLKINEEEITCNFGVNWFYKHFKEQTGKDMFVDAISSSIATTDAFEFYADLYFAGYLAECSLKKQDPKFTKEDFRSTVLSMEPQEAGKLITDYLDLIAPEWKEQINSNGVGEFHAQA